MPTCACTRARPWACTNKNPKLLLSHTAFCFSARAGAFSKWQKSKRRKGWRVVLWSWPCWPHLSSVSVHLCILEKWGGRICTVHYLKCYDLRIVLCSFPVFHSWGLLEEDNTEEDLMKVSSLLSEEGRVQNRPTSKKSAALGRPWTP